MHYTHHSHHHMYHPPRKMGVSDTLLLVAIGIIMGATVLIGYEAMAADSVRVTRPDTTVDLQANSSANVEVGPVKADTTLRSDTDAELRSDEDGVNDGAEDRVFNKRSDMNNTIRGPLWNRPGSADDPDNASGTARNDIRSTARVDSGNRSTATGSSLNIDAAGSVNR